MSINNLSQLLSLVDNDLKLVSGSISSKITNVSTPTNVKKGSLVFVSSNDHWTNCLKGQPALVITLESVSLGDVPRELCVLSTKNIKKTMCQVLSLFDKSPTKVHTGAHPTAVIASDALIGKNVTIGAHSSIGSGVTIGDNSFLGPNVVIENHAKIGENTIIHAQVFVGHNCQIGNQCILHPHTTIGSDGFGFYTNSHYKHEKTPQIGNVIIGDHVEVGANCCIDRATIDSTIIGSGSKLDNLCHIAHNCTVGEDSMIAAGFFVAGSSQLGQRFTAGGNTVVSTHLKVADGVMLAGRSTVTNHITEAGQYGGYPLQPLKEALKTIATLGTIVDMRKKINLILKSLSIKD